MLPGDGEATLLCLRMGRRCPAASKAVYRHPNNHAPMCHATDPPDSSRATGAGVGVQHGGLLHRDIQQPAQVERDPSIIDCSW